MKIIFFIESNEASQGWRAHTFHNHSAISARWFTLMNAFWKRCLIERRGRLFEKKYAKENTCRSWFAAKNTPRGIVVLFQTRTIRAWALNFYHATLLSPKRNGKIGKIAPEISQIFPEIFPEIFPRNADLAWCFWSGCQKVHTGALLRNATTVGYLISRPPQIRSRIRVRKFHGKIKKIYLSMEISRKYFRKSSRKWKFIPRSSKGMKWPQV